MSTTTHVDRAPGTTNGLLLRAFSTRPRSISRAVAPVAPASGHDRGRHTSRHAAPSRVPVLLPALLLGVSSAVIGVLALPAGDAYGTATTSGGMSGVTALGPTTRAVAPLTPNSGSVLSPSLLSPSAGVDRELALVDEAAARSAGGTPSASTSPMARSRSEAPVLTAPLTTVDGHEILGSKAALLAAPSVVQPVVGPVTSGFGPRWGRLHAGLDFGVPVGTPIVAAMDGVVLRTSSSRGGYGNLTVLEHADGTQTSYAHQDQILVTDGQVVKVGERIGLSGNSGHSTGPHLHFEVRPGGGDAVDPRAWLSQGR